MNGHHGIDRFASVGDRDGNANLLFLPGVRVNLAARRCTSFRKPWCWKATGRA